MLLAAIAAIPMSFAYASSIQLIFSPYIDFGRKRCSFSYQHFSGRALLVELTNRTLMTIGYNIY
jgi:hypothetical protein